MRNSWTVIQGFQLAHLNKFLLGTLSNTQKCREKSLGPISCLLFKHF